VLHPRLQWDNEPIHLLVDGTGLKLCGTGERLREKHGTEARRSWRKLHIGLDPETGQFIAVTLTRKDVDDGAEVGPLLDQMPGRVASFTADCTCGQEGVSAATAERHPRATSELCNTARYGQIQPEQNDDRADQPFGLMQGQAEHGPKRQGRGDGQRRIAQLSAPRGLGLCLPGRDHRIREPHAQAGAPAPGRIIFRLVRGPDLLLREMMTPAGIGLGTASCGLLENDAPTPSQKSNPSKPPSRPMPHSQ
jgi:hypothetical protein